MDGKEPSLGIIPIRSDQTCVWGAFDIDEYNLDHKNLVGKIKTIFASDESNYYVHKEIVEVQKNDVVQIFTHNCKDRAIIGDLICKYLILYNHLFYIF